MQLAKMSFDEISDLTADVLSFYNKRTTGGSLQIPVAQCFIRHRRTTEVRGLNPTEVVVKFFCIFCEIHLHTTARFKLNPLMDRLTSIRNGFTGPFSCRVFQRSRLTSD